MRYLISVSYDGSKYNGFQRLKSNNSVQKELEKALTKINKGSVLIKGAGRTDAKVHAYDQKCHFDLKVNIPVDRLSNAINSLLPDSIYVKDAKIVKKDFHARFTVKRKRYIYKIYTGDYNPLLNDYVLFDKGLDIKKMKKASKYLIGVHDYKNFISGTHKNTQSIIYRINIQKKKQYIIIKFEGKSFYRYMVRNLVGLLVMVGHNKIDILDIPSYFDKESKVVVTAKANGLYLDKIWY